MVSGRSSSKFNWSDSLPRSVIGRSEFVNKSNDLLKDLVVNVLVDRCFMHDDTGGVAYVKRKS